MRNNVDATVMGSANTLQTSP